MNDSSDSSDYLWTRAGTVDADIEAVEDALRPLGWQARPLRFPEAQVAQVAQVAQLAQVASPVVELASRRPEARREPDDERRGAVGRWWPAVFAGVAAAAAVFAASFFLHGQGPEAPRREIESPVEPASQPPSPAFPGDPDPDPDPSSNPDPWPGPSVTPSPDLKDPFSSIDGRIEARPGELADPFADRPTTRPRSPGDAGGKKRRSSPDLKDPFGGSGEPYEEPNHLPEDLLVDPSERPGVKDPFGDPPPPSPKVSPDLQDPFAARD